jgi:hypothetical protein
MSFPSCDDGHYIPGPANLEQYYMKLNQVDETSTRVGMNNADGIGSHG